MLIRNLKPQIKRHDCDQAKSENDLELSVFAVNKVADTP